MAEVIRMPRMSDTMTEGVIVEWHKKVGDKVKSGDLLAEVETDKATMELESYNDGTLLHIGVDKGKSVAVDGLLAIIGKEGEDIKGLLADTKPPTAQVEKKEVAAPQASNDKPQTTNDKAVATKVELPAGAKEIRMPLLSDTMTEGKIIAWNKKVGDFVKSDDVLAEVETDKATMDVVGYEEGTLLYTGVEAGSAAKVNEIIAIVGKAGTDVTAYVAAEKSGANTPAPEGEKNTASENAAANRTAQPAIAQQETNNAHPQTPNVSSNGRIIASPLAKKLAQEKGIDLGALNGSGDGGRITKKDVDSYVPSNKQSASTAPTVQQPMIAGTESFTDTPNTQMRKVIARRLGESKFSAPHFYLTMEINMDNAMTARAAMNEVSPVKISFNDLIIKACATALRQHPDVNSSWMGDFIRHNHHIHIGMAVAMPEGLIVPVIKFADQKTLSQISAEAKELGGKAKNKKLQPVEFTGNTFTISNLGMMDIDEFTAIINPPDSCILAVGRIKETVVKKGDGFGVSNFMKLTLSCDHRSVDGAVGAAFLQTVKKYLENPVTMLV
ncbi:MAG: pyruvate dehydrogenase complex dihydrolipoamide acetyltransferase [Ferruginibacter sp.]